MHWMPFGSAIFAKIWLKRPDHGHLFCLVISNKQNINLRKHDMANYTFVPDSRYDLGTHGVKFSATDISIILEATGRVVFMKKFDAGLAFRCVDDLFEVGELKCQQEFVNRVDMSLPDAALWLEEQTGDNRFIGSNDSTDSGIYHVYRINECPVRLSTHNDFVLITCPCEGRDGDCSNDCYRYGE